MLLQTVRTWFNRPAAGLPPMLEPSLADAIDRLPQTGGKSLPSSRPISDTWPYERLKVAEMLWGEGAVRPGGAPEVVRLGRTLTGTSSATVMLVGAGPGGAAAGIAQNLGLIVTGFEADPALAAVAVERLRRSPMTKRIQTRTWDPWNPAFGRHEFHHAICVEPLRGAPSVPFLTACTEALRPAGQFVMAELVADQQLDRGDEQLAAWARLEPTRGLDFPTEREITRSLSRLGFHVRVAEDITERHIHLCLLGWRVLVRELKRDNLPVSHAYWMLREAELWQTRIKLMQQGKLRLVRWHAQGRPASFASGHELV
jgi:protein-L-isoaspartate O-methyltransferase